MLQFYRIRARDYSNKGDSEFTVYTPISVFAMVASLALSSCSFHALSNTSNNNDTMVQEMTTPAGHQFWYYPMPEADRTALAIAWAQEVPLDESMHPGTARIGIEVMLNGGAGGRDGADIVADYEDLDAGSGLWVQPRHVSGFIVAPDFHLAKAREIAGQVLSKPAFEQRWFEREHQNYIESAVDYNADSWGMAWNLTREVLVDDHPYRNFWEASPTEATNAITLADVKKWHQSSFSTNSSTVTVAGSATPETVAKEIDLLFADMPENEPTKPVAFDKPEVPGKTILLHIPDAPKSIVVLMGNFPAHSQVTDIPLKLAVGVLGFGKQSRLFKSVRSGLGASYGFGANIEPYTREHRMLEMTGEVETAKLQVALDEIENAYSTFRISGIGRIEFPLAKRIYKREATKSLQSPVNVAFSVSEAVQNGFTADYVPNVLDTIDSVTREGANTIISESFPAYEELLKVIVSPDETAVEGACVISRIEDAKGCL